MSDLQVFIKNLVIFLFQVILNLNVLTNSGWHQFSGPNCSEHVINKNFKLCQEPIAGNCYVEVEAGFRIAIVDGNDVEN